MRSFFRIYVHSKTASAIGIIGTILAFLFGAAGVVFVVLSWGMQVILFLPIGIILLFYASRYIYHTSGLIADKVALQALVNSNKETFHKKIGSVSG